MVDDGLEALYRASVTHLELNGFIVLQTITGDVGKTKYCVRVSTCRNEYSRSSLVEDELNIHDVTNRSGHLNRCTPSDFCTRHGPSDCICPFLRTS